MHHAKIYLGVEPGFYAYLREEAGIRELGISELASKIITDGYEVPAETVVTSLLRDAITAKRSREANKSPPPPA